MVAFLLSLNWLMAVIVLQIWYIFFSKHWSISTCEPEITCECVSRLLTFSSDVHFCSCDLFYQAFRATPLKIQYQHTFQIRNISGLSELNVCLLWLADVYRSFPVWIYSWVNLSKSSFLKLPRNPFLLRWISKLFDEYCSTGLAFVMK